MSGLIPISYENKPCYNIHLEEDFQQLVPYLEALGYHNKRRICIVTDSNVAKLYLEEVQDLLKRTFFACTSFVFPAGESSKHTGTVEQVYTHLIQQGFDRRDLLVALGGGVVGDLTGFTAATYLRGIDFVQIPTTLLAQVDSSIGGKTGVDFQQYKNMVGAFYMPRMVYMNLRTLNTLSPEQFSAGMGEVLKHGQIRDASYFQWMCRHSKDIMDRQLEALNYVVSGSCGIKGQVVQEDPKEQGVRGLLNFGHTIGHSVEKLSGFRLLHGQCVALGMVSAAYLSCEFGYSQEDFKELIRSLEEFGLPVKLKDPDFTPEEVLAATKLDKKMDAGKIKFILLHKPGEAYITRELTDGQLLEGIKYIFE